METREFNNPLASGESYHTIIHEGDMIHVGRHVIIMLELEGDGAFFAVPWSEMKPMMREAYKRHVEKEDAIKAALAQAQQVPVEKPKKGRRP